MAVGRALQHVLEVGERLDVIELCGGYALTIDRSTVRGKDSLLVD